MSSDVLNAGAQTGAVVAHGLEQCAVQFIAATARNQLDGGRARELRSGAGGFNAEFLHGVQTGLHA